MAKKANIDLSTEEKIKEAARLVFTKKGYAATRTRDIAEEAGINLALLNYYFRSKEKLFELVMFESVQRFFNSMKGILNDEGTTLDQKLELLIARYIDVLSAEPNFPFFMLSEMQASPDKLAQKLDARDFIGKTVFFKQLMAYMTKHKIKLHPVHYIMNIIGITVFPFLGRPLLKVVMKLSDKEFNELMQERKKLIPLWLKTAMKAG